MDIYDYKRIVRCMGDVSLDDKAMVVARMDKNGQIIVQNAGDKEARKAIYIQMACCYPISATQSTVIPSKEGGEQ